MRMRNLLLWTAAAAWLASCDPALAATYRLDLDWKTLAFTNRPALGELATVELLNIGASDPPNLTLYLSNRGGSMLAITEGMNAISNGATAGLALNTTNLLAEFDSIPPQGSKSFDLSIWDSSRSILLASAPIDVRNNPLWETLSFTNLPSIESLGLGEYLSRANDWTSATATARYTLDLGWKDLTFDNSMAVAERAVVEIRGIGDAEPTALMLWLSNPQMEGLAVTPMMAASGTNGTAAIGMLNLATTNLLAEFDGRRPDAERRFDLSIWDTQRDVLLGSAAVHIRNNPLARHFVEGWTNVPSAVESQFLASIVAYGTGTNEAYRGDWGASVSNAAVLRSIATVPASDAYSAPASESLPFVVTNTGALTLSGLTDGSIGIRLTTTNASGIALYAAVVKDGDGETIAIINPACDGTEQSARWPWNDSDTLTVEASDIASPAGEAESAIITAVQVETWKNISLVGRTNDLADQHLYVDYPAVTNEAANRAYADDAADASLALALGEIETATFNRDLAGYVQRWNPRFDTVADSNSLSTLYGGSTALRLDGEGATVVPEILAFAVEAGEVATLTVWSYSGGAANLVPEVTTNLITGAWEQKPESIVSATNIDAFTAQVVFTNDFERLLYVRLVDVSGGSGVPVFRVFGGIAFGDGEAITNWPQGTILGATINEPHTVATNDGILAFTVTADGSGFPLTNDVSAAGFDLQGVGWFSAQNATISNNATVSKSFSVGGNAQIGGTLAVHDDMTVYGNLAVIGYSSNIQWHYLNVYTQVNGGTFTNFITENRYSTNNVYLVTNIVNTTYTTQFVDYVSVAGSDVDYSLSENVMLPHLYDYRDDKAYPVGTWNFSSSTVERITIPADGLALASVAAFDSGTATIDLGSNWCWRLVADTDCTAINFSTASVPKGDLVPNTVKAILLEVSRGEGAAWAWGGHLSHITNDAPAAGAVSHLLLIAPSQDVTATNGWTVF